MNKLNFSVVLMALFLFSVGTLNAQMATDRPGQTDCSTTVGKGVFQIESGFTAAFADDSISTTQQLMVPAASFRVGITGGIELRFITQLESIKSNGQSATGMSDLQVGAKIQIFDKESSSTKIAFISQLLVPSGSKALTGNTYGTFNRFSLSHQLCDNVGLAYNVGYNYFGKDNGDLSYTLNFGFGINSKTSVFIESYGEVSNFEELAMSCDGGFTYLAKENLQFDLSFGTGLTSRSNYIGIGVSWQLNSSN